MIIVLYTVIYVMHDLFADLKTKFAESKEIADLSKNFVMVNLEVSPAKETFCADIMFESN